MSIERSNAILLKVSEKEKQKLAEMASANGMKVGTFIRWALLYKGKEGD